MEEIAKRDETEDLPSEDLINPLTERQKRGLIRLARLDEIPETQAELAKALGVSERSLYDWWNTKSWCMAVYDLVRRTRLKHLPAIESPLIKKAREGSYLHQKGFYRLIGIDLENAETNQPQVIISFNHEPG
jgi:hypothetical protein